MPQQLSQISVLPARNPDLRKAILQPQFQNARPGDPSSACVLASYESRRRPRSTTQTAARKVVVQTSAHAHLPPFPRAPSFSRPRGRDRTSPLPHDAAVALPVTLLYLYPQTQFAERPGGNHIL